ncbi:MAG: Gfo/Idh/MocA family oxidoreductase [Planctomycetota bacterium]|nr:Gfo/Idh/MocA family oxidoreductase [Planctomycetota bacterium]
MSCVLNRRANAVMKAGGMHVHTRRSFLHAAGVAAIAGPYVLTRRARGAETARRPAPGDRITMALIGCGGMGNANLNGFLNKPEVQVVAVCDPDRSRREQSRARVNEFHAGRTRSGTYKGCDAYNDFREILARDDVDAIIVATPDHWHALIVIAAARAGKDVYGEKPLTAWLRQGRDMCEAVRRSGCVFQTGSQQRSDGRFRFACELVRNGRIGDVHTVRVGLPPGAATGNHPPIPVPDGFDYDLWLGPAPWAPYCEQRTHYNFRYILDYSGGKLCDWGAHHIDIAQWGLGTMESGPVGIEGAGEYPADGLWNTAVNYRFTATYGDGVRVVVSNRFAQGVKFEGDEGWVFVKRGRIDTEPKSLLSSTIGAGEIHLYPSGDHRQNFLDCVRSRRRTAAPIEHAHRTITIAHLANIAMRLKRRIRWDPARERIIGDAEAERMTSRAMREPWRL